MMWSLQAIWFEKNNFPCWPFLILFRYKYLICLQTLLHLNNSSAAFAKTKVSLSQTMHCSTCTIKLFISTLTDFGHPENQIVSRKAGDQKSGNTYPLLLIAGLIILRPLQLEEGNQGSASSSLPTMAPENTLGGVDLPPPRPFGILMLCVYVCLI